MEALRRYLFEHRLSQDAFGKKVGVTQAQVSSWLRGASKPSAESLIEISKETGIPTDVLLGLRAA